MADFADGLPYTPHTLFPFLSYNQNIIRLLHSQYPQVFTGKLVAIYFFSKSWALTCWLPDHRRINSLWQSTDSGLSPECSPSRAFRFRRCRNRTEIEADDVTLVCSRSGDDITSELVAREARAKVLDGRRNTIQPPLWQLLDARRRPHGDGGRLQSKPWPVIYGT